MNVNFRSQSPVQAKNKSFKSLRVEIPEGQESATKKLETVIPNAESIKYLGGFISSRDPKANYSNFEVSFRPKNYVKLVEEGYVDRLKLETKITSNENHYHNLIFDMGNKWLSQIIPDYK